MCTQNQPPEFQMGDEPVHVELRPGPASMLLSISLSPEEVEAVGQAADFHGQFLSAYAKEAVLKAAFAPQSKVISWKV